MPVSYTAEPDYFADSKELLAVNDHVEMDISVDGWPKTLRIRSLATPQREKINRIAGVGDKRDWLRFYVMTIVEGVVRPRLTPQEAGELVEYHNGQSIEELSDAIWSIGGLFDVYQRYMAALEKVKNEKASIDGPEAD